MESELDLDEDLRKFGEIALNMELLQPLIDSSVAIVNILFYFLRR